MRAYTPARCAGRRCARFLRLRLGRPRPAYLELPLDLLKRAGRRWLARTRRRRAGRCPIPPQIAEAAASRLAGAKHPVIAPGRRRARSRQGGARHRREARRHHPHHHAGKGVVPERHPLVPRLSHGAAMPVKKLLREADVVLGAGIGIVRDRFLGFELHPSTRPDPHRPRSGHARPPASCRYRHPRRCRADARRHRRTHCRARTASVAARRTRTRRGAAWRASPSTTTRLRKMLRQVLAVIRDALPRETVDRLRHDADRLCRERDFPGGRAAHLAASGRLRHARLRASRRHRRQIRLSPTSRSR